MLKGPSMNIPQQGMGQGTAAMQSLYRLGLGVRSATRSLKRRSRKRASSTGKRKSRKASSASRKSSRPARLVKGSAAAKAYMAKIRKKRK